LIEDKLYYRFWQTAKINNFRRNFIVCEKTT